MINKIIIFRHLAIIPLLLVLVMKGYGQHRPVELEYLSPRPGALHVSTGTNVSARLTGEALREGWEIAGITLENERGIIIAGAVKTALDGVTVIFEPRSQLVTSSKYTAHILLTGDREVTGRKRFSYSFTTSSRNPGDWPETLMKKIREMYTSPQDDLSSETVMIADTVPTAVNDSLPPEFPEITITHWVNPSPAYTFIQPLNYPAWTFYTIILDNFGTPVFYRSVPMGGMDFKLQPNGVLTWWDASVDNGKFFVIDDRGNMLDTIGMGNGYTTDLHELRMEEDGDFWTLGYDPQIVGMDTVVPGGQPDATVVGLIVQKLDADENVVFQWRSWDHYLITDASWWIELTDSVIDYVHGNSIALESDTSILISCRNMDEITKIDTRTGNIIWRFGGEKDQFSYTGSDQGFSVQHSIREMKNGHFSIFDNGTGNTPIPHYSSAIEYEINENEMTALEVQRIKREPGIHAPFMGHAQRLDNGNTVCGWGPAVPSVTEFDKDGNMMLEFSFPFTNYRGFKFPWKTTLFDISQDTLDFNNVWPEVADSSEITLTNPNPEPLEIHRIIHHGGIFDFDLEAPFTIPANGEVSFTVRFEPDTIGQWFDVLTFAHEVHEENFHMRVARQIFIKGKNDDGSFIPGYSPPEENFVVFPNPNLGQFVIGFSDTDPKDIIISDLDGKVVKEMKQITTDKVFLSLGDHSPGIYLIRVNNLKSKETRSQKVLVY